MSSITKADEKLFQVGATVNIIYALLELKMQPASDGGINYSKTVIEMSISTREADDTGRSAQSSRQNFPF